MNTAYDKALDTEQREFARRLGILSHTFTGYSPVPTERDRRVLQAAAPARAARGRLRAAVGRAWRAVDGWRQRRRAIAHLTALDDRLLADIGITRPDIASAVLGRQPREFGALPAARVDWDAPERLRAANRSVFADAA